MSSQVDISTESVQAAIASMVSPVTVGGKCIYCGLPPDTYEYCWLCLKKAREVLSALAKRRDELEQQITVLAGHQFGDWPATDPRRVFVAGAKWWEFEQTGGTMWASDRDKAEAEATRRIGAQK